MTTANEFSVGDRVGHERLGRGEIVFVSSLSSRAFLVKFDEIDSPLLHNGCKEYVSDRQDCWWFVGNTSTQLTKFNTCTESAEKHWWRE